MQRGCIELQKGQEIRQLMFSQWNCSFVGFHLEPDASNDAHYRCNDFVVVLSGEVNKGKSLDEWDFSLI